MSTAIYYVSDTTGCFSYDMKKDFIMKQLYLLKNMDTKGTSPVAQTVKYLPTMWETRVRALGGEDPLEKEMATHSSTLAWKIPWTEEPGRLQSMGLQRVGHDWASLLHFMDTKDSGPKLPIYNKKCLKGKVYLPIILRLIISQKTSNLSKL